MKIMRLFSIWCLIAILATVYCIDGAVHVVTTTADSGPGSLRHAILGSNSDGSVPRSINFNIAPGGIQTIVLVTPLPAITASQTSVNGATQPGWTANNPQIVIDGGGNPDLITIDGATGCTIQDLVINNGSNYGIGFVNGANNGSVLGCFLGVDQTGSVAVPLFIGIGAIAPTPQSITGLTIGAPHRGNVISGNALVGIFLSGNISDAIIQSNLIGTNKTGIVAIPNVQSGMGVVSLPFTDNCLATNITIGGLNPDEGNVISGNAPFAGPALFLGFQPVDGVTIQGNIIGLNKMGNAIIANGIGITTLVDPLQAAAIDNVTIEGNTISGNNNSGIVLQYRTNNAVIIHNKIGTDITGTIPLGNISSGVSLTSDNPGITCSNNRIGGTSLYDRNIISDNIGMGVFIAGNVTDTVIQGNFIGTDVTGTVAMGNTNNGIEIQCNDTLSATGTLIGGSENGAGNIIAHSIGGILLRTNVHDTRIEGNFIGTDATGTLDLGNLGDGILIESQITGDLACTNNSIGGLISGQGNSIKFNNYGIRIGGGPNQPDILNPILGNSIFLNTAGGIDLYDGGNNLQEAPIINSATICEDDAVLTVTVTAPENPVASNFRIEIFVNSLDNSPITEGELFVGSFSSVPSGETATQSFVIPLSVTAGMWVSSTATNFNNVGNTLGDTSEYSSHVLIQPATPVTVSLTAAPSTFISGGSSTLTVNFTGAAPLNAVWSDNVIQNNVVSPLIRTVFPSFSTQYSVTVTSAEGCSDSATVFLTVEQEDPLLSALTSIYCSDV